ncbi:MAG: hypothetical protein M1829_000345 [Trizodia sp. TS-e1964]|nr:MAG: hypothetical protein M1829_000345 [Trizodia sp. TS-e1964]
MTDPQPEQKTIAILGAGFAGLAIAHRLLKTVLPSLPSSTPPTQYKILLVAPSTLAFWQIGAPRSLVPINAAAEPLDSYFGSILPAFAAYPDGAFEFVEGRAEGVDLTACVLRVKLADGKREREVHYHALVIATGVATASHVWGIYESLETTRAAIQEIRDKLPSAMSVVIVGGGPVGVETAGEVGSAYGKKAKITLISGSERLLASVRADVGERAKRFLTEMGVDVRCGVRVDAAEPGEGGETNIKLSNGETLSAAVYIDASGTKPITSFLPAEILTSTGAVRTNPHTLRVEPESATGGLVYAIGDAASYSRGQTMDAKDAAPQLQATMQFDLSGRKMGTEGDYERVRTTTEVLVSPIGRAKGVGVIYGWWAPSWLVWLVKGRDYMLARFNDLLAGN